MQKITLELTIDQINSILFSLGKMPFESVYELIGEVRSQANPQFIENNKKIMEVVK